MGTRAKIWLLAALWLGPLMIYGIIWGIWYRVPLFAEGMAGRQGLDQWMMANFWSYSVLFWIWLGTVLLVTGIILLIPSYTNDHGYRRRDHSSGTPAALKAIGIAAIIGSLASYTVTTFILIDSDKDDAQHYADSVVYYVEDLENIPASLERLTDAAVRNDAEDCPLVNNESDVPNCVREGSLPESGWDARVGSLSGAITTLGRASGDKAGVSLETSTVTYLNASDGQPARWSGILDGISPNPDKPNINQPMGGVAEWTGNGLPTQCEFEGDFAIDRAFNGSRSKSLSNLMAEQFPDIRYNISDAWGYCGDNDEPIVVIPMYRQVYSDYGMFTADTAAGIVTVRGDNGRAVLDHIETVMPGQYPGPVYPMSLVATQREQSVWSAGREAMDRSTFGYEPTDSIAQAENVSEYLLRDADTGRLVWVTPMTLTKSGSQLFVAYTVTYADEVQDGALNELSIFVLPDDDYRRVNIDKLGSDAKDYLSRQDPGFYPSDGVLVEFIPVNGDIWRAFGERDGQVVYRLDISASNANPPTLVRIGPDGQPVGSPTSPESPDDGTGTPPNGEPTATDCGQPLAELPPDQLILCAQQFLDELATRQQGLDPALPSND